MTTGESTAGAVSADRTVAIAATDQLRYSPDAVEVRAGETVAFKVTNTGTAMHEFAIGDLAAQQRHEQEMAHGGQMGAISGGVASVEVPAGKTATLVYRFTKPGTLLYGCHVSGHYSAGMQGTITITPSQDSGAMSLQEPK